MTALEKYINTGKINSRMCAYVAQLENISESAPEVARSIVNELADQRSRIKLIASENYSSIACQGAMGTLLTDKYAEGFAQHRYYSGCENVDAVEMLASETACELFGADHAYVQPHSGADANLCAYWAIIDHRVQAPLLKEMNVTDASKLTRDDWNKIRQATGNQRLLGLDYYSGGHLTHGYRMNVSAQMFDAYSYGVNKDTDLLDYDEIRRIAMEVKPLILLTGYSAYPRKINFRIFREIADACGATLMVDMAHFAGLVAGKVFTGDYNPVLWADVVTTTTHKTLRGPRGGMILCKQEYAESVDKGCPLVIGGPLPHVMAAKAVALAEASTPAFEDYAHRIVENAQAMADEFTKLGVRVTTGGTDNHLMLVDVTGFGLNGRQAENALVACKVATNRNALPYDVNGPWYTSGLRIGVPAVTTLGMGPQEMKEIASIITLILSNTKPATIATGANAGKPSKNKVVTDPAVLEEAKSRVKALLSRFVLYPELDLEFLQENFC